MKFHKVEFDPAYNSERDGEYKGTGGNVALISLIAINEHGLEKAFERRTGHNFRSILSCSADVFDQGGNPIKPEPEEVTQTEVVITLASAPEFETFCIPCQAVVADPSSPCPGCNSANDMVDQPKVVA
jgi:hypothetical protein